MVGQRGVGVAKAYQGLGALGDSGRRELCQKPGEESEWGKTGGHW